MKSLFLLALCVFALVGCGGSGSNPSIDRRLAGTYEGAWANVADPEDRGVSTWTIGEDGTLTGEDVDESGEFAYDVTGHVDAQGNVDATTSLVDGEEVYALSGRLQFDSQGRLTGNLVWDSNPPLTYAYRFTRSEP